MWGFGVCLCPVEANVMWLMWTQVVLSGFSINFIDSWSYHEFVSKLIAFRSRLHQGCGTGGVCMKCLEQTLEKFREKLFSSFLNL